MLPFLINFIMKKDYLNNQFTLLIRASLYSLGATYRCKVQQEISPLKWMDLEQEGISVSSRVIHRAPHRYLVVNCCPFKKNWDEPPVEEVVGRLPDEKPSFIDDSSIRHQKQTNGLVEDWRAAIWGTIKGFSQECFEKRKEVLKKLKTVIPCVQSVENLKEGIVLDFKKYGDSLDLIDEEKLFDPLDLTRRITMQEFGKTKEYKLLRTYHILDFHKKISNVDSTLPDSKIKLMRVLSSALKIEVDGKNVKNLLAYFGGDVISFFKQGSV